MIYGTDGITARRLTAEEHFEADIISHIAFHMRMEDPEKVRAESVRMTAEDWGAFGPEGKMMARIIRHRFECRMNGRVIRNGGIGAVSTLPEYRNTGAIRAIFSELLPAARCDGEVISTLYPFSHAFYRKFGYETVCPKAVYEFAPGALKEYRFDGTAEQWKPGEDLGVWLDLYHAFAAGYNLSIQRSAESFRKAHFEGLYYRDRKFAYLLRNGGEPAAYVIFQDIRHDPAAILKVEDLAWKGRDGLRAVLGFLSRFSADYGTIQLPLPNGLELYSLIHSPDAYGISKRTEQGYMIRVVNAQKLLETLPLPGGASFSIRITDELLPENDGVWTVENGAAARTENQPDLAVNIRTLGQLAAGGISLAEAEYKEDVTVYGNREILERVFTRRPILVQDQF